MTDFIDLGNMTRQGPIFWAACAAVALGLAMIAAAVVVQARRLGRRFAGRKDSEIPAVASSGSVSRQEPAAVPAQDIFIPSAPSREVPVTTFPEAARLQALLRRLESIADRLDLAENLEPSSDPDSVISGQNRTSPEESGLKDEVQGVEYVFRAAGG